MMRPFTNQGSDLLHLHLTYDTATDNYFVRTNRIVEGFKEPTDAVLMEIMYILLNMAVRVGNIWKITLPKDMKQTQKNKIKKPGSKNLKIISMRKIFLSLFLLLFFTNIISSQTYSIVIKDGHVIDPKNNIDEIMDIAINNGKIVQVAKNIDTGNALQVVNAKGLYVTPGLIDIHTHNFAGTNPDQAYMNGPNAVAPDGFTFRVGVTTVVDAGSSGWRTFPEFKKNIIDKSQTRVLAFLNIVGEGMRGGTYEQNVNDMDSKLTANVAKSNRKDVVGIKLAHYEGHEWTPG